MKRFRVGVIGAGIMGQRMMEAMRGHPAFEVAAAFDPDAAAQANARAAIPGLALAATPEALVAAPGLDAVYIASPPAWHLAHMQAALAAGLPVLCEKPLAASLPQARAIRDAVAQAGVACAVNFPFARAPGPRRLCELAASGELGRIENASITLRFARWPRGWQEGAAGWLATPEQGGFTREVLSHFVFLAQRVFGPLHIASAQLEREPGHTETRLAATLRHAGGTVKVDAAVEGEIDDYNRFELTGTKGVAAVTDWYRLEAPGEPAAGSSSPTPHTLDAFACMLQGDAGHGLATVGEAYHVAEIVEALLASR